MRLKLLLVVTFLLLFVAEARAEMEYKCVGNCGSSSQPSNPVRYNSVPASSNPAQLQQQTQQKEGWDQNEKGVECYHNKDWACAIKYFQAALENRPNDPIILGNLNKAREAADEEATTLRDAATASEMHQAINRLTTILNQERVGKGFGGSGSSATVSPGLEFMGSTPVANPSRQNRVKGRAAVPAQEPLQFMTGSTPLTQGAPTSPGASAATAGEGTKALDQAHTSNKETRQGLESGGLANMKEQSDKVFDSPVSLESAGINPAVDLRNTGKAPPLPDYVKKDKKVMQMRKDRDALRATQLKKDTELVQIRKQIETETDSAKKGDLMVKAVQIKAESLQAGYQAAVKDKDIETRAKRLIDTHVEKTPPASSDRKTSRPDASKTGN